MESELLLYSILFFSLFILSAILIDKMKMNFLNPFSLFFLPIFAYLGVSFLGIEKHMTAFKPLTWLVLLSSWFAYIIALLMVEAISQNKFPAQSNHPNTDNSFKNYNWRGHLIFAWFIFSLSCISFAFTYNDINSTVLFSGNAHELLHSNKLYSGPYPFFYFQTGAILPISLFMISSIKAWNSNTRLRLFSTFSLILSIIITFCFLPTKGMTMQIGIFWIGLKILTGFKIKAYHILFTPILAIVIFMGVVFFQTGLFISQILLPYEYISNNFWNLDYALNKTNLGWPENPHYIFSALNGICFFLPTWTDVLRGLNMDTLYNESAIKVKGLNTVTFQWHLYKDMGMISLIIGSFILGLINSWLWKCILHNPKPFYIAVYSTLIFCIVQSTFAGQWTVPTIILWIFGNGLCAYMFSSSPDTSNYKLSNDESKIEILNFQRKD